VGQFFFETHVKRQILLKTQYNIQYKYLVYLVLGLPISHGIFLILLPEPNDLNMIYFQKLYIETTKLLS